MMFLLLLQYIQPISEVEKEVPAHGLFLDKYYAAGKFICSGRKVPRSGGIILCNADSREEVDSIIGEDPFYVKKVAEYQVIEFLPTKFAPGFEAFVKESQPG